MGAVTAAVLRHRRLVGLIWLLLLLAGGGASARLNTRLDQSFDIPGTPSAAAARAIIAEYHSGGSEDPLVAVVRLPAGSSVYQPRAAADLGAGFAGLAAAAPGGSRVASYASTGSRSFVSADGRTTFGLIFPPTNGNMLQDPHIATGRLRRALLARLPAGSQAQVTGIAPLTTAGGAPKGPGVLGEILIGGLGALAVLSFVFASFLAVMPLVIAAASVTTAFLAILAMTYLTSVNVVVEYLAGLIGLGVAVDYSLLLITRWREAVSRGHGNEDAIRVAMATAGRAIVFSGGTVALGLITLVAVPVPFIRGIGVAGMLIPLISVAATLTIVPALLAGAGRRLDWPRLRRETMPARGWSGWARLVLRRRWIAAGAALAVLGALGAAALNMRVGDVSVNALSVTGQARQGVVLLEQARIPLGVLTPIEAYLPAGTSPARVAAAVSAVPGIRGVVAPGGPAWRRNGTAVLEILPAAEGASPEGQQAAAAVRAALARSAPRAGITGAGAGVADQIHSLYGRFPLMLAILAVITFVLLARAFRSLLLPLKAVLANLVSVGAAYGALVLVWQDGYGSQAIWGLPAAGAITAWIPLFVFAFLYGLSMDYEVFLLARMREEYDRTGSTATAVVTGLGRTGRLVTSAALILFLAMAALASAPVTFLKVFATGVGAGILLDAAVVRSLLVPALVCLLGRWNWWMPRWAAAVLRVRPSPARREQPVPPAAAGRLAQA
jgi:RND superfamily putative drug exporter